MYTLCIIAAEKFLNTGNVHVKNKFVNVFDFDMIVIILKHKKINDNKILVKYNVFLTRSFSVIKKSGLMVSKLVSKLFSRMSYCSSF